MKIVYISHATIPSRTANSIQVMKMCHAFAKEGNEVVLISANKTKDSQSIIPDIYQFYGVEKIFQLITLPWLRIKGVRRRFFALLGTLKAKKLKPDLVYTRCIFSCFLAGKFGLPVILEIHTPIKGKKNLKKSLFSKAIHSSQLKKMIVITQSLKEHYEQRYPLRKGLIHVAPDGADPVPEGVMPTRLPNKGRRLQVGYVGHLYKGKGFEVVSQLPSLCGFADFHILGGTDDLLDFYMRKYNNIENLKFHGHLPHAKTVEYLLAFDIVLLPNQNIMYTTDKERDIGQWTSPLKLFEYMAAGRPIIASNLPVLREILEDERNALLCPPDDIQSWRIALKRLQDKNLRQRLGSMACKDFMDNYTWEIRIKKILS